MNESDYQALVEASWWRSLTVEEQLRLDGWLAAHPQARVDWEAERSLNGLLTNLSDAPVASNFTAQVLQAVDRSEPAERRKPSLIEQIRRFDPPYQVLFPLNRSACEPLDPAALRVPV